MQPGPEEAHLGEVQHVRVGLAQLHEGLQLGHFPWIHAALLGQHTTRCMWWRGKREEKQAPSQLTRLAYLTLILPCTGLMNERYNLDLPHDLKH